MRGLAMMGMACVLVVGGGCGGQEPTVQKPAQPAVPADVQAAAEGALGAQAEVLAYGDLAKNGKQQVLTINRLHKAGLQPVTGALLTRLAIVENDDDRWTEVLLCDEHLKNPKGFLGGTPRDGVPVWRLQFDQDPARGLLLYLVPYNPDAPAEHPIPVGVRWNPDAQRYQAMDRNYEHFQGESVMLEQPSRQLR